MDDPLVTVMAGSVLAARRRPYLRPSAQVFVSHAAADEDLRGALSVHFDGCDFSGSPFTGAAVRPLDAGSIAPREGRGAAWREVAREVASLAGAFHGSHTLRFEGLGAAAAFKGAKKKDVEGILDGFAALGVLTAFRTAAGRRWRAAGKVR
jgi:hypothetical protein